MQVNYHKYTFFKFTDIKRNNNNWFEIFSIADKNTFQQQVLLYFAEVQNVVFINKNNDFILDISIINLIYQLESILIMYLHNHIKHSFLLYPEFVHDICQ